MKLTYLWYLSVVAIIIICYIIIIYIYVLLFCCAWTDENDERSSKRINKKKNSRKQARRPKTLWKINDRKMSIYMYEYKYARSSFCSNLSIFFHSKNEKKNFFNGYYFPSKNNRSLPFIYRIQRKLAKISFVAAAIFSVSHTLLFMMLMMIRFTHSLIKH